MTVPKSHRKEGIVLWLHRPKPDDCDEQVANRREELAKVNEEIADGHLWAERCRQAIRAALEEGETG